MNWTQYSGHMAFIVSVLLTLGCVLVFKAWHTRDARRSPLQGKQVGHLPGQQLLKRIGDHHDELLVSVLLMFIAFPLMFAVWAGSRVSWDTVCIGAGEIMFLLVALSFFGFGLYRYVQHYRLREQAHDGLVAERVTGMQLNRLMAQGCRVLHDLPAEGFNIDHVVVAPRAVYAVETKSFRKPKGIPNDEACKVGYDGTGLKFPDLFTRDPIEQATRQAKWLRGVLEEAMKQEIPVIPAVALPGWYVQRDEAARSAQVNVFTPMGKGADFLARGPERLDARQREMIAQALALRYPTIEDSGRRD